MVVTPGHELQVDETAAGLLCTCSCNYPGFRLMWSDERLAAVYVIHLEHVLLVHGLAASGRPSWIRDRAA